MVRGECTGQNALISASGYEQGRDSRDFCWFDACMQGMFVDVTISKRKETVNLVAWYKVTFAVCRKRNSV